ncbi:hypothetical protein C8Q79DRAFT_219556 [Trametes meyenii]|nr:hypothetical protein C8Q79DRAFT_219556 [Trametes meyenii]
MQGGRLVLMSILPIIARYACADRLRRQAVWIYIAVFDCRDSPHPLTTYQTRCPHELAYGRIPRLIQKHDLAHMNESDVLFFVRTAHRQSIHSIASSAWLLYDLLTTFDQEMEFVWRSANTLPKYLYFVSRYGGLFGQL